MTTILQDRLERFLKHDVHLRSGAGNGVSGDNFDVCINQAADYLSGGNGTNARPECVSRSVGSFTIRLNDSLLFAKHKDLLKPYAAKIVGTNTNRKDEVRRTFIAADSAVRVAAPIWLLALAETAEPEIRARLENRATILKCVTPVRDSASAEDAHSVARALLSMALETRCEDWAAAAAVLQAADWAVAEAALAAALAAATEDAAADAFAAWTVADAATESAAVAWAADTHAFAAREKIIASHGHLLRAKALECLDALIAVGKAAA